MRIEFDAKTYPVISAYTKPIMPPKRRTLGRKNIIETVLANLARPIISNVLLLGPAGSGKTAIVVETARQDVDRCYLEVDLAKMSSSDGGKVDGSVEMASRMKRLVDEIMAYQTDNPGHELVIFMDEIHQISKLSPAAMQAIKPLLAESGARKIKIIAATTHKEYEQYILSDEALSQRFERVTVQAPSEKVIIRILESMYKLYLPGTTIDHNLVDMIIRITNRYLPADSQPRKSVRVFDAMIGRHKQFNAPINEQTLALTMKASFDVEINWTVNMSTIRDQLNNRVLDQPAATDAIIRRLYLSVTGLAPEHKPQGSFLFTGSTGVGKTEMAKALTASVFGSETAMIRFDMSEYGDENSDAVFKPELAARIQEQPYAVVLLDEIEKAHPKVTRLLLQVLDEGRLTNEYGRPVSFENAYIIMTSNAAADIYAQLSSYVESSDRKATLNEYSRLIRRSLLTSTDSFPTELLNRMDAFVPFMPLSRTSLKHIGLLRLSEISSVIWTKKHVRLHFASQVIDYLVDENADDSTDNGGGRGVMRRIEEEIESSIAELISEQPKVTDIAIRVVGEMASLDKSMRIGDASIQVSPWAPKPTTLADQRKQLAKL